MDYLDFDVEIGAGSERSYPVAVRSPAGQAQGSMRFPFDTLELENALLRLKNALLSSGGTRRAALSESETAVQAFGQKLFEALLTDDLRSLYYESKRESARLGKGGLRLRLHIRAPELAGLPWEYLYDPRVPDYLCLSKKTPLVRYLDLAHPVEPLTVAPPLRILAMTASPSDQAELNIAREQERMRRALGPLEEKGLVRLTWLEGQTARDLQRALQRGPWHIFHFIGHGDYDARTEQGVLALCNDQGKTTLLYATPLASLLSDHDALRLTILNACNGAKGSQRNVFSSTAATLAQRGIPAVLAMQEEITDDAATEWTHAFYEALATGMPVDEAVAEARQAIMVNVNNSLEWGTPVLFLRAADGVLFHLDEAPPPEPPTPPLPVPVSPEITAPQGVVEPPPPLPDVTKVEAQASTLSTLRGVSSPQLAAPSIPGPTLKTKEGWVDEGTAHWRVGRHTEALAAYERALALDPMFARAWNGKGTVLYSLRRYPEALKAYEWAVYLDPHLVLAWNNKGSTLCCLRRYQEALAAYERTLYLDPMNVFAWNERGNALSSLRRYPEALAAHERALALDPKFIRAWFGKSNTLYILRRYQEALAAYERALALDQRLAWAWNGKGNALHSLQRYTEALANYDWGLQLDPNDAIAWNNKANTLDRLGRWSEAQQARWKARALGYKG